MSKQNNAQLVQDYIVWLEQACNGVASAEATPNRFLAPTFHSHTLPDGWPKGQAGVSETVAQTRYAFETVQLRAEAVAADDHGAMLHFTIVGTLKGGGAVRREGLAHYLIADGRITEHWCYDFDPSTQAPKPKPAGGGISDPGQPAERTADDWGTLGEPKPVGGGISDPGQPAERTAVDDWGTLGEPKPVGGGISDLP